MLSAKNKTCILCCVAVLALTACSNGTVNTDDSATNLDSEVTSVAEISKYQYNNEITNDTLNVVGFVDCFTAEYDISPKYRVHNDDIYMLGHKKEADAFKQYFNVYHGSEKKVDSLSLPSKDELNNSDILSFDYYKDGFVFLTSDNTLVFTDIESNCQKTAHLSFIEGNEETFRIFSDKNGHIFLIGTSSIYVTDGDGNKIDEYSGDSSMQFFNPVSDADGNLIFPRHNSDKSEISFFMGESLNGEPLGTIPSDMVNDVIGVVEDTVFFHDFKNVYGWNTASGEVNQMISFDKLGVGQYDTIIPIKDKEECAIYCISGNSHWLAVLSKEQVEISDSIDVMILDRTDSNMTSYLQSSAARFGRNNPQYAVSFSYINDEEYDRDRFLIDMAGGEGPDIILVSQSDAEVMGEKGLLADLDSLLSKETIDSILPCAKELGTYNGAYFGLTPMINIITLYTNDEIWEKSSWSLDDIYEISTNNPDTEIFSFSYGGMYPEQLMYYLAEFDLEGNGFYDSKTGESKFEKAGFDKLLTLAKEFSAENVDGDGAKKVAEGKSFGLWMPTHSPFSYADNCANVGNGGHAVGFPTNDGQGNYAQTNGLIVVNKDAKNTEAISAFFEYLLSIQNQINISTGGIGVRMDLAKYCIKYDDFNKKYVWQVPNNGCYELPKQIDMDQFIKEWNDFLLSAKPSRIDEVIMGIVEEEAESFFNGNKDALSVTKVIDNRVQLYLNEKK